MEAAKRTAKTVFVVLLINVFSRALGLLQAMVLPLMEKRANTTVKIRSSCNGCRICVEICPMHNLAYENGRITHKHNCTMCYRCVNKCPKKAITVAYHGKVRWQFKGVAKHCNGK